MTCLGTLVQKHRPNHPAANVGPDGAGNDSVKDEVNEEDEWLEYGEDDVRFVAKEPAAPREPAPREPSPATPRPAGVEESKEEPSDPFHWPPRGEACPRRAPRRAEAR